MLKTPNDVIKNVKKTIKYHKNFNRKYTDYFNIPFDTTLPLPADAVEVMKKGCKLLDELNVKYCLADGTLLGVIRDNRLIPHDTDIDIAVLHPVDANKIETEFVKNGFKVGRRAAFKGNIQQIVFYTESNCLFDIIFYTQIGDEVYNFCERDFYFQHHFVNYETVVPHEFEGHTFYIPQYAENWLEMTYGDWRTPNGGKPKDWREGGDQYLTAVPYDGDIAKTIDELVTFHKNKSIKQKLNLNFYKGDDSYSDGDVENDILEMTTKTSDFTEILKNDNRWAVLYHLTPLRRNLLEWYDFDKNSTLLEIGAGCGALTNMFCEKVKHVTAVELSKRRAEIILNRTHDKNNLEIIVGNLNDIKFDKKFDYITLIGVLEYAGRFTNTDNPYGDFLKQVKQYLNPGGTLIIAIENKFGLKYWAGAREDHSGKFFDSIENYPKNIGIETFGNHELRELIEDSGFSDIDFYYPLPDYKIPNLIFSDDHIPNIGQIVDSSPNYDSDRLTLFDEKLALDNIIKNKQFGFFANSFLVFCKSEIKVGATNEKNI